MKLRAYIQLSCSLEMASGIFKMFGREVYAFNTKCAVKNAVLKLGFLKSLDVGLVFYSSGIL